MSRCLVLAVLCAAFMPSVAQADDPHYFTPLVSASIAMQPLPGGYAIVTTWMSSLSVFNNSNVVGSLQPLRAYGPLTIEPTCLVTPFTILPNSGEAVWDPSGCFHLAGGVGFLEFTLSPGMLASCEVERVVYHGECGPSPPTSGKPIPQGRAPVPVYKGLFPANTPVITTEIELGMPSAAECVSANQRYLRRVNLTLLNPGDEGADFSVTAFPLRDSSTPVATFTATLAPHEVRQLNRLDIPLLDTPTTSTEGSVRVWLRVQSTQPFVGYASSIFEGGEPDSMPFEVFPLHMP